MQEQHDREDAVRQVREFQAAEAAAKQQRSVESSAVLREQQQHRVEEAAEASREQRAYESRMQAAEAKARRLEAAAKSASALAEDFRRAAKAEKHKIKKIEAGGRAAGVRQEGAVGRVVIYKKSYVII